MKKLIALVIVLTAVLLTAGSVVGGGAAGAATAAAPPKPTVTVTTTTTVTVPPVTTTVTPPPATVTQTVTTTATTTTTVTAPPVTTTVTVTGTTPPPPPSCTGTNVAPGTGLKAAVDAAPAGTTFCLGSGVYTISATTTLQDGDKLIGVSPSATSIEGNGTVQNMFDGASGGTFEVRDLSVSGAVGDANATCSPDCGRAFMGDGDKWTFDGIRCHDNQNQCIGTGSADVFFLNSECDHNGNAAFAAATNRSTSCIKRVRGGTSSINTVVQSSDFHDNYWSAIWFDFYEGQATIENNTFTDNGKSGVQVEVTGGFSAFDNILVQNNTFHGNGLAAVSPVDGGVICANCADTLVQANTFGGNSAAVAFVQSAREWGGYINVRVLNNTLAGDPLSCPASGVTCSGNTP